MDIIPERLEVKERKKSRDLRELSARAHSWVMEKSGGSSAIPKRKYQSFDALISNAQQWLDTQEGIRIISIQSINYKKSKGPSLYKASGGEEGRYFWGIDLVYCLKGGS